jgi:septal ring-binding cell division protein DamX
MSASEIEPAVVTQVLPQTAPRDDVEESNPIPVAAEEQAGAAAADDSELVTTVPVTDEQDSVTGKLAAAVTTSSEGEPLAVTTSTAVDEIVATAEPMPAAAQVQQATVTDDAIALDSSQSESALTSATQVESAPSATSRLQRDLQAALEWINGRDSGVGTLQVMVLSQDRFDEQVYYGYVERLARQGVDISQLRIFETYTNNQKVYSVVFGEFQNRGAANAAKADLPKILLEAAPFPRSVGGLMTEIQRLEAEN